MDRQPLRHLARVYYAVQNNANAINMSFDFKTASTELQNALDYANQRNVICAASAGTTAKVPLRHQAGLSRGITKRCKWAWRRPATRNPLFLLNFGNAIVWVGPQAKRS